MPVFAHNLCFDSPILSNQQKLLLVPLTVHGRIDSNRVITCTGSQPIRIYVSLNYSRECNYSSIEIGSNTFYMNSFVCSPKLQYSQYKPLICGRVFPIPCSGKRWITCITILLYKHRSNSIVLLLVVK